MYYRYRVVRRIKVSIQRMDWSLGQRHLQKKKKNYRFNKWVSKNEEKF